MKQNTKRVIAFTALTYLVSYTFVAVYLALGGNWTLPWSIVAAAGYMLIPAAVAIILQKFVYKEPVREPLGISFKLNRWFLVAWLLPVILAFAILGVNLLMPGVEYAPGMEGMFEKYQGSLTPEQVEMMKEQIAALPIHPIWLGVIQGLIAGVTINAVFAFGEELGWRGFLQKELGYLGFWKSSAVIGLIWGFWHAPLILQGHNYPQHPVTGVFMMTIFTLLMSPIFSYLRLRAKSVIAAAVMHGTLNAIFGLSILVIKGGNDLTVGGTGAAGFMVLAVVNFGIFVYHRFVAREPVSA